MPRTTQASVQRNHWALAVLALLRERDMHPYEMRRLIRERHKEERLVLKAGSLYHAIAWLERGGLIRVVGTGRQGKRPERTTYRITTPGKAAFLKSLADLVSLPCKEPSSFAVGLDHLVHLSPTEAAELLSQRLEQLKHRVQDVDQPLRALAAKIGRVNLLEVEFEQAMLRAEIAWARGILDDLRSGSLAWDIEQILRYLRVGAKSKPTGGKPEPTNR
jgi:DNA-binding PadR family transcriptional regulator